LTAAYAEDVRQVRLGADYTAGVEEAGGLPLVLPVPYALLGGPASDGPGAARRIAAGVLDAVDGLILTGGGDLDPAYFGEGPVPGLGAIEPARDQFEIALAGLALERGLPILGICRGVQVLAVAAGGDLYQDLPSQRPGSLKHRQEAPRHALTHSVEVEDGTVLARLLRPGTFAVNTFHHQAVRRVPDGFRVSAVAPDGVIEAIEATGAGGGTMGGTMGGAMGAASGSTSGGAMGGTAGWPVLGVQWHPENLWSRDRMFLNLFTGLVGAAARYREISAQYRKTLDR